VVVSPYSNRRLYLCMRLMSPLTLKILYVWESFGLAFMVANVYLLNNAPTHQVPATGKTILLRLYSREGHLDVFTTYSFWLVYVILKCVTYMGLSVIVLVGLWLRAGGRGKRGIK
jgi:hypothetical protein